MSMMIDDEITMKMNENIKMINQKIDDMTSQLNKKEEEFKNQKIQTVNGLNNVFVPYLEDGIIPSEAWDKIKALHSTYDEILKQESVFHTEKEVTLESIGNLESKKSILKDALKAYGEVATNKEIVETPKEENSHISAVEPVMESFTAPIEPEPVFEVKHDQISTPEPVIQPTPVETKPIQFPQHVDNANVAPGFDLTPEVEPAPVKTMTA